MAHGAGVTWTSWRRRRQIGVDQLAPTRRTYSPAGGERQPPAPPPWRSSSAAYAHLLPRAPPPPPATSAGRPPSRRVSTAGQRPWSWRQTRAAGDGAASWRARRTSNRASAGPWPSTARSRGTADERTRPTVFAHNTSHHTVHC